MTNRCGQHIYAGDHVQVTSTAMGARMFTQGTGTVRIHWHYDGCVFDVDMDLGGVKHIRPDCGDTITIVDDNNRPSVLSLSSTVYNAAYALKR